MCTLCDLSNENTTILISYEERTTGNKPQLEKKFHQVMNFSSRVVGYEAQVFCCNTYFSLCFTKEMQEFKKENLAAHQKGLRAFLYLRLVEFQH